MNAYKIVLITALALSTFVTISRTGKPGGKPLAASTAAIATVINAGLILCAVFA